MSIPTLGRLESLPALDHPELLAPPVVAALAAWEHGGELAVVEIDPSVADTAAMSEAYDLGMDTGANCVVVGGKRDGAGAGRGLPGPRRHPGRRQQRRQADPRRAQVLVPVDGPGGRGVRRWSTAGSRRSGCPRDWRLLVDARVLEIDVAVIGSGVRRSKLLIPGRLAGALPGAEVSGGNWRADGG